MNYRQLEKAFVERESQLPASAFEPAADEYESLASHDAHNIAAEELAHTRIRQLERDLSYTNSKYTRLEDAFLRGKKRISELESLLAEADARDARNIKLVHDLESRIAQLESQIDDWSRDHAKLNDDLDDMTAVYDEQQSRIAQLEAALKAIVMQLNNSLHFAERLAGIRRIIESIPNLILKS